MQMWYGASRYLTYHTNLGFSTKPTSKGKLALLENTFRVIQWIYKYDVIAVQVTGLGRVILRIPLVLLKWIVILYNANNDKLLNNVNISDLS